MIQEWLKTTPLRKEPPWNERTQHRIVNFFINLLWLLRIFSPAAWILSFCRVEDREDGISSSAWRTELYVLTINVLFLIALVAAPIQWVQHWLASIIIVLFILDTCQYHVYLMIVRPEIDKAYSQYSFTRTILLTLISYQGLITLFGLLYLSIFSDSFNGLPPDNPNLNRASAWALSAAILTGSGFSGIVPKPGTSASIIGGIESIIGIIFLTTILALAVNRASVKRN
jgi:hypothetical protein